MLYEEFLEGTGVDASEMNARLFDQANALYMNGAYKDKEEVYKNWKPIMKKYNEEIKRSGEKRYQNILSNTKALNDISSILKNEKKYKDSFGISYREYQSWNNEFGRVVAMDIEMMYMNKTKIIHVNL